MTTAINENIFGGGTADAIPTLKGASKANPAKWKSISRRKAPAKTKKKAKTLFQKRGRGKSDVSTIDKNPAPWKKRKSAEFISSSSSSSSDSDTSNNNLKEL